MAGGYSSSAVEDETRFIQHEPHGRPKFTRDEQLLRLGVVVRREQAHESQAVNDNNSGGGDVVRKRKRNMFEDDNDDAEVSRSGARYELRWGSGTSQSSRIVRVSRSSGGKDRHSKVLTAKGLRDRRVRLSVSTAIQFYDLQDRLGFDQPSKAVEWLLNAAAAAIDDLPLLDHALGTGTFSNALHRSPSPNYSNNLPSITNTNHQGDAAAGGINVDAKSPTAPGIFSTNLRSSIEGRQGELMMLQRQRDQQRQAQAQSHSPPALGKHKMSSSSTKSNSGGGEEEEIRATASASKETADNYHPGLSLSRLESRVKARARARERGKGKFQSTANVAADNYSLVQNQHGARDTFIGLLNSVADVALESRDTNQNDHRTGLSMHSYSSHALDHQFHDRAQPILHSPSMMHQHSKTTSEDHNNHLLPSFASNPSAHPVLSHDPALNLTMPAFAGRETLQSNSYNNIMAYYTQNPHISLFTTARNTYVQGIYDGRMLHSSNHDCDAAQGSLKGRDKLHPTDHN